jgi:hypothetical protein
LLTKEPNSHKSCGAVFLKFTKSRHQLIFTQHRPNGRKHCGKEEYFGAGMTDAKQGLRQPASVFGDPSDKFENPNTGTETLETSLNVAAKREWG